ncbi:hypothetical protein Pcinc_004369 [Petrolisthes cinctipes]|uniref:Uncharacterized protein n=1 Tax=Petrolisthes cinctipes TaxID=88211 RepID=A0AAE1GEM0_PETCI|nr:hypothetical protein Pcinc_004369 [Petrolisthes cinctipes]
MGKGKYTRAKVRSKATGATAVFTISLLSPPVVSLCLIPPTAIERRCGKPQVNLLLKQFAEKLREQPGHCRVVVGRRDFSGIIPSILSYPQHHHQHPVLSSPAYHQHLHLHLHHHSRNLILSSQPSSPPSPPSSSPNTPPCYPTTSTTTSTTTSPLMHISIH